MSTPHAGLHAVTKEVSREGKTHEQTFYVKDEAPGSKPNGGADVAPAAAEKPTKHKGHETVAALGGNPKKSKELILGFRANVFHPKGVEFKGAVGKAFGVPVQNDTDRIAKLLQQHAKRQYERPPEKELKVARTTIQKQLDKGATQHVATVAAVAKASQAHYDEPHVTLYRGITGTQAAEIIAAHKSGQPINVKMDTTTSFTDDHGVASQFARVGSTRRAASPHAVVVKVKVPRESIVASHRAFKELDKEAEVIVATHGGHTIDPGDVQILAGG